ncbi:MAG: hypothetical protein ABSB89_00470 [Candidatus Bathyarchaeia archaeon]
MAGATIDHLVAFVIFLAALLLFIGFYNQMNQTAIVYQYHTSIATKCSDVLDSMLLNPGSPSDWGLSDSSTQSLTFFGVQDPEFQEYRLSPFSVMRLLSPSAQQYNNVSWNVNGGYLLVQSSECIGYHSVTSMLGINGTYDFQLSITPTITVSISQVPSTYLELEIQAYGTGFPLSNATVNYLMFWATPGTSGSYPVLNYNFTSNLLQTDSSGMALIPFPSLSSGTAFCFIAEVYTGGIYGTGYLAQDTVTTAGNLIPYIESYDGGTAKIMLAQIGMGNLYFNASFYALPNNFLPAQAGNFVGTVNSGTPNENLTITTSNQTGFLVVAYGDGSNCGMVITPLGVSSLGTPVTFGASVSGKNWVATDLRQVLIGDIAYQAKLSLWSLQGTGVTG